MPDEPKTVAISELPPRPKRAPDEKKDASVAKLEAEYAAAWAEYKKLAKAGTSPNPDKIAAHKKAMAIEKKAAGLRLEFREGRNVTPPPVS